MKTLKIVAIIFLFILIGQFLPADFALGSVELYESWTNESGSSAYDCDKNSRIGQQFTVGYQGTNENFILDKFRLKLYHDNKQPDWNVNIYLTDGDDVMEESTWYASTTLSTADIPETSSPGSWVDIDMPDYELQAGEDYAILMTNDNTGTPTTSNVWWMRTSGYNGGDSFDCYEFFGSWTCTQSTPGGLLFEVWGTQVGDGAIDPDHKYAWGENVGWINFGTANGNVHVTDTGLSGYALGENIGWICLDGVANDSEGNLSGYAWGENVGWIKFDPDNGGVSIDSSGVFSGYALGENIGWIHFCDLATDWRPQSARPNCSDHNVEGWAWSENIGWVSFSCENTVNIDEGIDFGVDIDSETGFFSGYAWSENIGWISFNRWACNGGDNIGLYCEDDGDCPDATCEDITGSPPDAPPGDPFGPDRLAKVDLLNGEITGWARALSHGDGWDGWIKLGPDTSYGVNIQRVNGYSEFYGWAWGGNSPISSAVVGWLSFNCKNLDTCATTSYQVTTDLILNSAPTAKFECEISSSTYPCGEGCECNGLPEWVAYNEASYGLINTSTDPDNNIASSTWIITGDNEVTIPCIVDPLCDLNVGNFPGYGCGPGDYEVSLKVEDEGELISTTTPKAITIRRDIEAGFACSLSATGTWQECNELPRIRRGNVVYFWDDPSTLCDHSTSSEVGGNIVKWEWKVGEVIFGSSSMASTTISDPATDIYLTVWDETGEKGRSDQVRKDLETILPAPRWREIRSR